ncbi:MAG: response regulator transcription factor [Oscillospiraceae bacterium]|nr:response regulator transcription factor [Oscillospiraceae bacterium]
MNRLRIAACDDEPEILDGFAYIIRECFAYHNVSVELDKYTDPTALAKAFKVGRYDLLFLDIDMPKINGIALARKLREAGSKVDIIYVSSKENLVFKVFDVHPFSFIRKNKFFEEIGGVIRLYLSNRSDDNINKLVINSKSGIVAFDLTNAIYIESTGKTQTVYYSGGQPSAEIKVTMQELDEKLTEKGFIRVHRGFLVNYKYIASIKDNMILLTTGGDVPMSRRSAGEVKDRYLRFMKWDNTTFC